MRALVLAVAAMVVSGCDAFDDDAVAPSAPPGQAVPAVQAPAATRAANAAAAARRLDGCRDLCEQNNILAGGGDDALRACRAGCDQRLGGPAAAAPHEVPSRITVAKPAHAPPLVQPARAAGSR